ncbi:hypothetical protein N7495_006428 [Penicillium taxi]|uniref:uncharacterized protein n=1 Tax=Penicillium taxi TaxID=168475 RepID=UPI0025450CAE|nr:uncharacterized protein N7495_006428 [Penicillium taxi]KAJ5894737.1 hypothetical protein N7495_006428 [Penicillium taxi]
MSEGTLASAVAIPDPSSIRQSTEVPSKRRNPSITDHESKRRRHSSQSDQASHPDLRVSLSAPQNMEKRPVRKVGPSDDRDRSRRLFGGLLGTLSGTSTSASQKRRADIQKRQQEKLKSQVDEFDKQRKERRNLIRRAESPFYAREAMRTRHAQLITSARFIKTYTLPSLLYKPYQLQPADRHLIQEQVKDAEDTIAREVAEFDSRYPPESFLPQTLPSVSALTSSSSPKTKSKNDRENMETMDTTKPSNVQAINDANRPTDEQAERDDDGSEVVEDNEDTVIY